MEKIKQGKMDKKTFWIAVAVVYLLIILLGVNIMTGDVLGDGGRLVIGVIAIVIYFAACAMRLRDAGKSVGLMLLMCIVPVYAFVIGCYESEESRSIEGSEGMKKDTENMDG